MNGLNTSTIFEHYHFELICFFLYGLNYIIDQGASNIQCEPAYLSLTFGDVGPLFSKSVIRHKSVFHQSSNQVVGKYYFNIELM